MTSLLAAFIVEPMAFVGAGWSGFMAFFSITRIRDISDIPAVASLTLDDLNQGTWTEQDGLWQYSVDVVVEAERDSFNVDIVVPAGDSELEYKATGSEGSLTVHVQDQVIIESSSNLFTSRVGHHE